MKNLRNAFLKYVKKTRKCWLWKGHIVPNGYGRFFFNYRQFLAHRKSYELFVGKIKHGNWILHRCDIKRCVKPKHLYAGSAKDNARDTSQRKRWAYGTRNGTYTHPETVRCGEQVNTAKLRCVDIPTILSDDRPQRIIAKSYGVTQRTIGSIKRRESWKIATAIRATLSGTGGSSD